MKQLRDMTEPELKNYFRYLATVVEGELPPGPGARGKALFTLLVFEEPELISQYVSNCRREDMIKVLRETADRLEAREDVTR